MAVNRNLHTIHLFIYWIELSDNDLIHKINFMFNMKFLDNKNEFMKEVIKEQFFIYYILYLKII